MNGRFTASGKMIDGQAVWTLWFDSFDETFSAEVGTYATGEDTTAMKDAWLAANPEHRVGDRPSDDYFWTRDADRDSTGGVWSSAW